MFVHHFFPVKNTFIIDTDISNPSVDIYDNRHTPIRENAFDLIIKNYSKEKDFFIFVCVKGNTSSNFLTPIVS